MRALKWVTMLLLIAATVGYIFLTLEYQDVQHQLLREQTLSGELSTVGKSILSPLKDSATDILGLTGLEQTAFAKQLKGFIPIDMSNSKAEVADPKRLARIDQYLKTSRWIIFACGLTLFIMAIISTGSSTPIIWLATLAFLTLGVSTPFLSIQVQSGSINLPLGNEIGNYILYFRLKSILDIVSTLFATQRLYEIILGVLVGFFSLVAPLIKLVVLPILSSSQFKSKVNNFLWRFAWVDVLAVSILVSFLATDQIIKSESASILFTGQSAIEDGMIFFLCYMAFAALQRH